jgi:hypothetical protein
MRIVAGVLSCLLALAACSSSSSDGNADNTNGAGADGLQQAALAWSSAYLTGSIEEIIELQGPACLTGEPINEETKQKAEADLAQLRDALEDFFETPVADIETRGVQVRDVNDERGEASVQYDLPAELLAADNWVAYEVVDGEWRVSNCRPPIAGNTTPRIQTVPSSTTTSP